MQKRTKRLAIASSAVIAVATFATYAVASASPGDDGYQVLDEPGRAGAPVSANEVEAESIPRKQCTKEGPTKQDGEIAKKLSPKMHSPRLNSLKADQVECARAIIAATKKHNLNE